MAGGDKVVRHSQAAVGFVTALALFAGYAQAEERCEVRSRYVAGNLQAPSRLVSFVFTGVDHERVELKVDETSLFEAELKTEDASTEYSGDVRCVLSGRYAFDAKIGDARGVVIFDVMQDATIYISAKDGVLTFNIWGPDAPGLD